MYEINTAAVIGAGTMGLGIAGQLANAGVDVVLLDVVTEGDNRNAVAERALQRLQDPRQPGLLDATMLDRIHIGNIEDDLDLLAGADWITEAVVERLEVKQALYRQIDALRKPGSIVSSNTSTIPLALLVEGMPEAFQAEFAITHFFNPVRYMQLLEIVRGEHTRDEVIDCLEAFNDQRMGKGIVVCADTPGFLANRVGCFAMQTALHAAFRRGLAPEQADAVFGRPLGVPKTGVFGLYDLIGIDLMADVVASLVSILPPEDAFHDVAGDIPEVRRMIDSGLLGNKSGKGGFYRDDETGRQTLDFERFEYREFQPCKPPAAAAAEAAGDFTILLAENDKFGRYAWEVLASTLCYAIDLVPEVNGSLLAIDDAMKLGYNWVEGPFEMVDRIGVDAFIARLEADGRDVPPFLARAAGGSFYRVHEGSLQYLQADGAWRELERPAGVIRFSEYRRTKLPLFENEVASYFRIDGQNVGLFEFHSKANTLNADTMELLKEAVRQAASHYQGLVLHNDAAHFSCGVNLASVLDFIVASDWAGLEQFLVDFQATVKAMRDTTIPVVAAPSGLSLGGGFEVLLHTDKVVYHANSVTGLVESLVGLVPGGGGVKETLHRWFERHGDMQKAAWETFKIVGYGKTARSPLEAEPLAMFRPDVDRFVMNRDRLMSTAIGEVHAMAQDYRPQPRAPLAMPGRETWDRMQEWLSAAREEGRLTAHDVTTGAQIARIVTGGDVAAGTWMEEDDLFELEREAFIDLAQTQETRARIEHMLEHGTPLRN